jgi:hypothetical protein
MLHIGVVHWSHFAPMGLLKKAAVPAPELRQAGQRRSLASPEWLYVYALKRFDAQARRQVAIFPCSRIPHTLRA